MRKEIEVELSNMQEVNQFEFVGVGNTIAFSNEHYALPEPVQSLRYNIEFNNGEIETYDIYVDSSGYLNFYDTSLRWT